MLSHFCFAKDLFSPHFHLKVIAWNLQSFKRQGYPALHVVDLLARKSVSECQQSDIVSQTKHIITYNEQPTADELH